MAVYRVWFVRNDSYDVEAESEKEAIDKAYKEFEAEKSRNTCVDTHYDECEVEELDDEEV